MTLFSPPHPGEALREDVLPEIKMTITALAKHFGLFACAAFQCDPLPCTDQC